jgi:hypothetical protein
LEKLKAMDNPVLVAVITLAAAAVLVLLVLLALSGGSGSRLGLAFRSFGRVCRDQALADQVAPLLAPPPPKDEKPPKPSGAPLRLLAVLQRDGRLVDFLLEDIQSYSDGDVGAAVRDIHRKCHAALKDHLALAPILPQTEGATVEVPRGFDPSAIRLVGNVTGEPPFQGVLQHHGWRVTELKLAPPPEGQDEFVLQPAEVELPGAVPPTGLAT